MEPVASFDERSASSAQGTKKGSSLAGIVIAFPHPAATGAFEWIISQRGSESRVFCAPSSSTRSFSVRSTRAASTPMFAGTRGVNCDPMGSTISKIRERYLVIANGARPRRRRPRQRQLLEALLKPP